MRDHLVSCRHPLDSQEFDEVYADEAAQCLEPWVWGLLRPAVQRIVLAGDTNQLPALVSETAKSCALIAAS